jgi:anti-sigma B factor antagonist
MELYYDEIDDDILILAADGGLNGETAETLVGEIGTLVDAGLRRIIIDCSKLDYVSSYGLGMLVRLHGKMKQRGGDVKVCALHGLVPQVLQLTKLDRLFDIHPDVNRARLSFRTPG